MPLAKRAIKKRRMIISHGYPVPLSSQQFQACLRAHFKERNGMIFLPEQFEAYEQKRKVAKHPPQMELFVCDERSAIYNELRVSTTNCADKRI